MNRPSSSNRKDKTSFSWQKRGLAFKYAWHGIKYAFRTQHNLWLHSVAAVAALILGAWLEISSTQWLLILMCISSVIALELVNTAIETLADRLYPGTDPRIGLVKDIAAAAVLVAAIMSLIIGSWIFVPQLLEVLK